MRTDIALDCVREFAVRLNERSGAWCRWSFGDRETPELWDALLERIDVLMGLLPRYMVNELVNFVIGVRAVDNVGLERLVKLKVGYCEDSQKGSGDGTESD